MEFTQVAMETFTGTTLRETGANTRTAIGIASTPRNRGNKLNNPGNRLNRTCKIGNSNPRWKDLTDRPKRASVDKRRPSGSKAVVLAEAAVAADNKQPPGD